MDNTKMAKLSDEDVEAIRSLEKKLGDKCLIAVEKGEAMYALEAKISPNVWEAIDKVYPEIKDLKAYYPDDETARLAKGALKSLLNSNKAYMKRKKPIRLRKIKE